MCFPSVDITDKAKGCCTSLPSQTYLVPLWGTAGVGTSAWPLVWQRGHSPGPGLPPDSTSPPAVARQHHTSCCTGGVKKQERQHERGTSYFSIAPKFFPLLRYPNPRFGSLFLRRFESNATLISNLFSPFFAGGKHP